MRAGTEREIGEQRQHLATLERGHWLAVAFDRG
jgi:hypothetical protein